MYYKMPRVTPISRKKYERFLKYIGCILKRQKGDHLVYVRSGLKRPVFIQRNNLRTLGLSIDEYLKILDQV